MLCLEAGSQSHLLPHIHVLYRHRNTVLTVLFQQGNKCQIVTKNTTIVEVTVSFLHL